MNIVYEIFINQYGQDLIAINSLKEIFNTMNLIEKRAFLKEFVYTFIQQSKALDNDIHDAIKMSCLKPTYTPSVMIQRGIDAHNLEKIIALPENELEKVFILFLSIFKIAYQRRFESEKDNPDKWWYWDMADENNIKKIKEQFKP